MPLMATRLFEYFQQYLGKVEHNYLEIGIWKGTSVSRLAKMFPVKHIYAIDPFIEDGYTQHTTGIERGNRLLTQREIALENVKGLENLTLFEMTSKAFFDSLTQEQIDQMDVAHVMIDGSHHYDDVIIDCQLAMKLIGNKAGTVAFDDTDVEGVIQAMEEFHESVSNRISSCENLHPNTRIYTLNANE